MTIELLSDIREAFDIEKATRLSSQRLCNLLATLGKPWSSFGKQHRPISRNELAHQLKVFDIAPRNIRIGTTVNKGYSLEDFTVVFSRYLPVTPLVKRYMPNATPETSATSTSATSATNTSATLPGFSEENGTRRKVMERNATPTSATLHSLLSNPQIPVLVVESAVLGETVFWCGNGSAKDALVAAGVNPGSVYTVDELSILTRHHVSTAELVALHGIKQTFDGRINAP